MIRIKIFRILESLLEAIEEATSRARDYVALCSTCGNRRSGKACADRILRSRGGVLFTSNSIWRYV